MWAALVRLRSWPCEIEADIRREYHADITDWHRLTLDSRGLPVLSSRRLVVLIDNLSENSAYMRAFTGNWPVWQQMLKHVANETALHRASLYAGGDNEYMPTVYRDPGEMAAAQAEADAEIKFYQDSGEELYGALGWS